MWRYRDINVYISGHPLLKVMNQKSNVVFSLVVTVTLAVAILATVIESEGFAQTSGNSSNASSVAPNPTNQKNAVNSINFTGTIPLQSTINKAMSSQVKISLIEAISTAQKLVGSNSSATLALLRPLIGYLVYDIHVTNKGNNTSYAIIVDPGSGQVLYHQALSPITSAGHQFMFGQGAAGPFFGGNRGGFGPHK
jgi:uncharacterized membrane protein YkoI